MFSYLVCMSFARAQTQQALRKDEAPKADQTLPVWKRRQIIASKQGQESNSGVSGAHKQS